MARARDVAGLTPQTPYAEAAAQTIAVRAEELWEHAEGVLDVGDPERVHAMRVATRRLRAVLEIFAPCLPRQAHREVLRDVKRLADALGERRDPDVQILGLEAMAQQVGGPERPGLAHLVGRLREQQSTGNAALEQAMAEAEAGDLRGRLEALAAAARAGVTT